jgi:hypothetical protein
MNIAFNTGAVCSNGPAFFDFFLLGKTEQFTVDYFPGLLRDTLDVAVQCRLLEPFVGDSNTAKPSDALGIHDMKGKVFVTEAEESFNHGAAKNLIGTHPLCADALGYRLSLIQILQNMPTNGRVAVDDVADHRELLALYVILNVGHEGHLFLPFFAHFVLRSFLLFVVILVSWRFHKYYKKY